MASSNAGRRSSQPEVALLLIAVACAGCNVFVNAFAAGMGWAMLLMLLCPVVVHLVVDAAPRLDVGVDAMMRLRSQISRRCGLARRDVLTGTANQRGFDEALAKAWVAAVASRTSLSMLMIQLDHFEQFNTRYGRREGEACLLRVSDVLRSALQANQLLARIGEEEFGVLLPTCGEQACFHLAEQLRREVARAAVEHECSAWGLVTISVGCATMLPAADQECLSLPAQARDALHQAKQRGRNRLVSPLTISPPLFLSLPIVDRAKGSYRAEAPHEPAPWIGGELPNRTWMLQAMPG